MLSAYVGYIRRTNQRVLQAVYPILAGRTRIHIISNPIGPLQPRRLFAPPPASRLFARWSADRRVHLHFTGCALPLLLYLWADLCLLGASFEAGIVRHPADT